MFAHPIPFLTPGRYLEIKRSAERRGEYDRSQMYAMAAGTHRHGVVIMNAGSGLRLALRETPHDKVAFDDPSLPGSVR